MAFSLPISVVISAMDKFSAPLANATKSVNTLKNKLEEYSAAQSKKSGSGGGIFGDVFSGVTAANLATAGLEKMKEGLKEVIDMVGDLNDLSNAIGVSTKALQEYQYAGKLVGVDTEAMNGALTKLTVQLGKGDNKGLEEALNGIGLSIDTLKNVKPDSMLEVVADAMASVEDPAVRAAIATQLFGKSNAKMVNLLSQGSGALEDLRKQAQATGAVIGQDTIDSLDTLGDSMDMVTMSIKGGFANAIGPLVPYLQKIADFVSKVASSFGKWINENKNLIQLRLHQAFELISNAAQVTWNIVSGLVDFGLKLNDAFGGKLFPAILIGVGAFKAMNLVMAVAPAIMGAVTGAMTFMQTVIFAVSAVTKGAATVWEAFNLVLAANPIGLVVAAIAALIAIGYLVVTNWDSIVKFFQGVWTAIVGAFKNAGAWLMNLWKGIWNWFSGLWAKWGNWIAGALAVLMPFIGIPLLIINNWGAISKFFQGLWSGIQSGAKAVCDWIGNAFKAAGDWLMNTWKGVWNWLTGFWSQWGNWISGALSVVLPFLGIPLLIINNWGEIQKFFGSMFDAIGKFFNDFVTGPLFQFLDGIGKAVDSVKEFFGLKAPEPATPVKWSGPASAEPAKIPAVGYGLSAPADDGGFGGSVPGAYGKPMAAPSGRNWATGNETGAYSSSISTTRTERSEVLIKFPDAPKGTRVENKNPANGVNLSMGFNNASF